MSDENENEFPESKKRNKVSRGALQAAGGAIPFVGGVFSAIAGSWSEAEQDRVNRFFRDWVQMLQEEIEEKERTIVEMMARIDLQDEEIAARVESKEFQSILKKTFRDWAGAESETKREYIRNILSNAASTQVTSDDVILLFVDWLQSYSELHFLVIASIYKRPGSTRGSIWHDLGKPSVREDSAEADLYRLLFRDLSTGGIVRQRRETDYYGNFIQKGKSVSPRNSGPKAMKSAFDTDDQYELTALGQQFVHYAMTDIPVRIEYDPEFKRE